MKSQFFLGVFRMRLQLWMKMLLNTRLRMSTMLNWQLMMILEEVKIEIKDWQSHLLICKSLKRNKKLQLLKKLFSSRETQGLNASVTDQYEAFGDEAWMRIRHLSSSNAKKIVKHLIINILFEAQIVLIGKYDNPLSASYSQPFPIQSCNIQQQFPTPMVPIYPNLNHHYEQPHHSVTTKSSYHLMSVKLWFKLTTFLIFFVENFKHIFINRIFIIYKTYCVSLTLM